MNLKIVKTLLSFILVLCLIYIIGFFTSGIYVNYTLQSSAEISSIPIEVVLVTTDKDFDVLPYSLHSIKKNIKHPITKVVLISPKSNKAINLAKNLGMEFIDENKLIDLNDFKKWFTNNNLKLQQKFTWYYQQFLKLSYAKFTKSKYYLIVDADLVITRPLIMLSNYDVHTFFVGHNMAHEAAGKSIANLLDDNVHIPKFSFIADMMCFNTQTTLNLLESIEKKFNTEFYKAAMLVEQNPAAHFSEYELYGTYANFVSSKILVSYEPRSNIMRKRYGLFFDKYNAALMAYPYIAYHDWVQ